MRHQDSQAGEKEEGLLIMVTKDSIFFACNVFVLNSTFDIVRVDFSYVSKYRISFMFL